MYLTRTFGRWQLELYQRAIHLTRTPKPDPNCRSCKGAGGHGYVTEDDSADWEDCHCIDQLRTWTVRFWPRRNPEKEFPF
jgi:hypothetical protein